MLSACAHQSTPSPNAPASAPRPLLPLAPPLGPSRRIVQQLTAHWPGQERTLLCVLELSGNKIAIAGLTPEGMSVFDLSYDGKLIESARSPLVPDLVQPERIVADVQLAYWPLDLLRKNLPTGLAIEAGTNFRRLTENGQTRIEVRYLSAETDWPRQVELTHLQYHYRLSIDTLSYEVLPE